MKTLINARFLRVLTIIFFVYTAIKFFPGQYTYDNKEIIANLTVGQLKDWHSPLYQLVIYGLSNIKGALFLFQLFLYSVCLFLFFRYTDSSFGMQSVVSFLLISPVIISFYEIVGKDTLFLSLLIVFLYTVIFLSRGNVFSLVLLVLLVVVRPNFILFIIAYAFYSCFFMRDRQSLFLSVIAVACLLILLNFQTEIVNLFGFHYVKQYPSQYFMISDIINIGIQNRNSEIFLVIDNIGACHKILDIDTAMYLKSINDINPSGVWNIDPFYTNSDYGICHIVNDDDFSLVRNIWLQSVLDHPIDWLLIRLHGFSQFFLHHSTSIKGYLAQVFYQPLFIFIISYYLRRSPALGAITFSLSVYFLSFVFYGFGYDNRYYMPLLITCYFALFFSFSSSKVAFPNKSVCD